MDREKWRRRRAEEKQLKSKRISRDKSPQNH